MQHGLPPEPSKSIGFAKLSMSSRDRRSPPPSYPRALTWSTSLQASAQSWANTCDFAHSQAGENLAAGTGNFNAAAAVQAWVSEASSYDASNPQPSHWTQGEFFVFTQREEYALPTSLVPVVWKATTQLGCGVASCSNIFPPEYGVAQYHVCHYNPVVC